MLGNSGRIAKRILHNKNGNKNKNGFLRNEIFKN